MPPKRKRRVAAEQKPPEPPAADAPLREQLRWLNDQQLTGAAIKAFEAAEIESILNRLRLVQSCISKEQQEAFTLQYLHENSPNILVVWNDKQNELELKWKDWDSRIFLDNCDVRKSFMEISAFNFNEFAWSELIDPEAQLAGAADALQTPGAVSTRLSFGRTPKTVRLPRKGEMLLFVRGSPLGVYKEENLAAVHDSKNGSEDAGS